MKARGRGGTVLRQLRTLYNIGTTGDLTDGQLLERFATDVGEVAELAFSALVERHEAMVQKTSEDLGFEKAKFAVEQAASKKKVLVEYTKAKTIKELQRDVETSRMDEKRKSDALDVSELEEKELEAQLGGKG